MTEDFEVAKTLLPPRDDKGHKTSFGSLLVVAGSEFMTGAAVLTVSSALRSGVGIVRFLSTEKALDPVRINCPCALTSSYEASENLLRTAADLLSKSTAAVIGPGLDASDPRNTEILLFLIENCDKLLIDASAHTILAHLGCSVLDIRREKGLSPVILTPHVGEFKRLSKEHISLDYDRFREDEISIATKAFCAGTGAVLVLKNHNTMVTAPDGKCYYMNGDNSGMAKGGSGDVLAGLTGGLLASGLDPVDAARAGVLIHIRAGKIASSDKTKIFMLPTDVIETLPQVYKELGW